MRYTAIIQNYGATRQKNWPAILDGLAEYPPELLIVWDNDATSPLPVEYFDMCGFPVHYIVSSVNHLLGCIAAVVLAETELILKLDNDLAIPGRSIEQLLEKASTTPAIVSPCASNLGADRARPYSYGYAARAPGPCDIVTGRVWASQRRALMGGFMWILENGNPSHAADIVFSLASAAGCVYMPVPYTNLDEGGIGLCLHPEHFKQRDAMAIRLRNGGRQTPATAPERDVEGQLTAANEFILEQVEQIERLKTELEYVRRFLGEAASLGRGPLPGS